MSKVEELTEEERFAITAAAQAFCNRGIHIACPWEGDLDDLERERYEALVAAIVAHNTIIGRSTEVTGVRDGVMIADGQTTYRIPAAAFSTMMAHGWLTRVGDGTFRLSHDHELLADPGSAGVRNADANSVAAVIRAALSAAPGVLDEGAGPVVVSAVEQRFKAGDQVKRVSGGEWLGMREGDEGVVTEVIPTPNNWSQLRIDGYAGIYSDFRYALAIPAVAPVS